MTEQYFQVFLSMDRSQGNIYIYIYIYKFPCNDTRVK